PFGNSSATVPGCQSGAPAAPGTMPALILTSTRSPAPKPATLSPPAPRVQHPAATVGEDPLLQSQRKGTAVSTRPPMRAIHAPPRRRLQNDKVVPPAGVRRTAPIPTATLRRYRRTDCSTKRQALQTPRRLCYSAA